MQYNTFFVSIALPAHSWAHEHISYVKDAARLDFSREPTLLAMLEHYLIGFAHFQHIIGASPFWPAYCVRIYLQWYLPTGGRA